MTTPLVPQELIRKKRLGERLTEAELADFFYGYLKGQVADYQVSAMLMAILFRGMAPEETVALTRVMRDSGDKYSWQVPAGATVDKHSTGGVGDKTSFIVLPLCLLEGLKVPMMAGRGLGHTGGTLDKLEAIGWNVLLAPDAAAAQMQSLGGMIIGQTEKIAPLDRKLYALRDVTATVESVPLIVGSILSKKLAAGVSALVMDVKFGSGAFMQSTTDAAALARALKTVGEGLGLKMRCLLTSMDSPLGDRAGNALEIQESVEVLQGHGPDDTRQLSVELAAEMVRFSRPAESLETIKARLNGYLKDGRAFAKFLDVARAQGADVSYLERPERLSRAKHRVDVMAAPGGPFVAKIDVRQLGMAILELGGGRRLVSDKVDPWVGLSGLKRVGAALAPSEPLATVHADSPDAAERAAAIVRAAYNMGDAPGVDILVKESI